jgi:hypothetical protein
MSYAVSILDGVVAKLNETTFGSATVERQILPRVEKRTLSVPKIIVALQGIESAEQDRSADYMSYTVGVGLSYPVSSDADYESALAMTEDIQDWISRTDNRNISTAEADFCLVPPFEMDGLFDPTTVNEAGIMFTLNNFNYRTIKNRRP